MRRAYTWILNLKPSLAYDWEHLFSLFNTKFFNAEAKIILAKKLGRTRQYPDMTCMRMWKKFHKRVLDCYELVLDDILVDVCFHGMIED